MPKRFNVVVPLPDGGVEVHPMKEWLRRHPEHVPPGFDPTSKTSHQLRAALKKAGWAVHESADEVRLVGGDSVAAAANIEEVLGFPENDDESPVDSATFALEAQLRDFIANNIGRVPVAGRRLALYSDPSGRTGVEYPTGVGPIDVLAVDPEGNFYVFELKLDRGPDRALGQLARYMGWVKLNLGRDRNVQGVIVARSMDERLRYASLVMPQIQLLEYEIDFRVKEVRSLAGVPS